MSTIPPLASDSYSPGSSLVMRDVSSAGAFVCLSEDAIASSRTLLVRVLPHRENFARCAIPTLGLWGGKGGTLYDLLALAMPWASQQSHAKYVFSIS